MLCAIALIPTMTPKCGFLAFVHISNKSDILIEIIVFSTVSPFLHVLKITLHSFFPVSYNIQLFAAIPYRRLQAFGIAYELNKKYCIFLACT